MPRPDRRRRRPRPPARPAPRSAAGPRPAFIPRFHGRSPHALGHACRVRADREASGRGPKSGTGGGRAGTIRPTTTRLRSSRSRSGRGGPACRTRSSRSPKPTVGDSSRQFTSLSFHIRHGGNESKSNAPHAFGLSGKALQTPRRLVGLHVDSHTNASPIEVESNRMACFEELISEPACDLIAILHGSRAHVMANLTGCQARRLTAQQRQSDRSRMHGGHRSGFVFCARLSCRKTCRRQWL